MSGERTSWTASELMSVSFPEPRWAVQGLIPEGLTLLAGAPKLGKSWLVLNLSCAIAAGGLALGTIPVDQGSVLYLALEDNGRRLQSRLRLVLGVDHPPEALTLEPIHVGGAERIRQWIENNPDARLVVVDVLARVRGRTARDVSVYEADYHTISSLKQLADLHGVAMIVVHHTRKMAADDFLDTISGSQGLAGAADTIAVLARSRGSAGAILRITGRDVEESEHPLDFHAATGTWKMLDGPASDYELGDTRRRIVAAIRLGIAMTPKHLCDALPDVKPGTIRLTLRRMAEAVSDR